jgi:carbamoyl-phosphate synthase large subunit
MEKKKILVSGAGGGGSNNLIRSIKAGDLQVGIIGTNSDKFELSQSLAAKNYHIPRGDSGDSYFAAMNKIILDEKIDLVIPNNDTEVGIIAAARDRIATKVFLPAADTVRLCQDKLAFSNTLAQNGFKVAKTFGVENLSDIESIFENFKGHEKLWCRMRKGSGSAGALPVSTPDQARSWIKYWQDMRNVPEGMFTLSEYLPGNDYAFQSVWKNGELILAKTCQRLEYHFARLMPSGTSSTPSLGKLVANPSVNKICTDVVHSIAPDATGMFSIDLKEDYDGNPCITEINIGRFFMITIVFNISGKNNMAETYLRLAFDEDVTIPAEERYDDIGDENTFLIRGLDNPAGVITESDLNARLISLV